jgi:hypothetical protein
MIEEDLSEYLEEHERSLLERPATTDVDPRVHNALIESLLMKLARMRWSQANRGTVRRGGAA